MSEPITPAISTRICKHMNEDHAEAIVLYAKVFGDSPQAESAEMISIDPLGMDLSVSVNGEYTPVRIPFDRQLETAEDAHHALIEMLKTARKTLT